MFFRSMRHLAPLIQSILTLLVLMIPAATVHGQNFEAVHKRLKKMVKKGELHQEHADAMFQALERMVEGQRRGQNDQDMDRRHRIEFEEMQRRKRDEFNEIASRIERAMSEGVISERDAKQQLAEVEREIFHRQPNNDPGNPELALDIEAQLRAIGERLREAVANGNLTGAEARENVDTWRDRLTEQYRMNRREREHERERDHEREREHERERDHEREQDHEREREHEDERRADQEFARGQLVKFRSAIAELQNELSEIGQGQAEAESRMEVLDQKRDALEKEKIKIESDRAKLENMLDRAQTTGSVKRNGRDVSVDQLSSLVQTKLKQMKAVENSIRANLSLAEVWEKNMATLEWKEKVTADKLREYQVRMSQFRGK